MTSFASLPLNDAFLANLETLGYSTMTPIQAESLPPVLEGRDLIAQAQTGSGKTAAFGIGLLYTIIVLFGSQGLHVVEQITSVLRVCAPLVVYFLVVFTSTAYVMWRMGFAYKISCVQSFTAASNNFELAIAVVVAVYGAGSQQALAATVGPLIEVPVLVALVYVIKWCKKRWAWE